MAEIMSYPIAIGEVWEIWMTGDTAKFQARIEQVEPPRLKLLGTGAERPFVLKDGDFILLRKLS